MVVRNGEKHDVLLKRSQEALLNRLNQVSMRLFIMSRFHKCYLPFID